MSAQGLEAARGWRWIVGGFTLFRKSPLTWMALTLVLALLWIASFLIPLVGPLVFNLLSPVLFAGLMLGCKALDEGQEIELAHLFSGFKSNATALVTIGGVYLVGSIVILSVVWAVLGDEALHAVRQKSPADLQVIAGAIRSMMLALLVGLALHLPLLMLIWFAPVLVVLRGAGAVDAMKLSLAACLVNWLAFLVYGAILLVLLFIASIPALLGLLVLLPVLICSIYVSYQDIFLASPPAPPANSNPFLR